MTVVGTKKTMTYHQLPESIREEELKVFISNYEWLRREISKDEAIQMLDDNPLEVEDVIYGIHGHMVHIKWQNIHWSVYEPEKFGYEKTVPYDKSRT